MMKTKTKILKSKMHREIGRRRHQLCVVLFSDFHHIRTCT